MHLNLDRNQLQTIPDCIGNLSELVELTLQYNYIDFIPETICELTNLEWWSEYPDYGGNQSYIIYNQNCWPIPDCIEPYLRV